MKGITTLTINKETLLEAMAEYFKSRMLEPHTVTDIAANYEQYTITIDFSPPMTHEEDALPYTTYKTA